jgi:hypothetical protein
VTRSQGLQPKLTDTIAKLLGKLADPSKLQESAEEMLKKPIDAAAMKEAAPQLKDHFADKLIEALKTAGKKGSAVSFASPFTLIDKDIIDYILNNKDKELKDGMPHVLMTGLKKIEKKKDKGKSTAKTETFWILVPGQVETALEEFFFVVTGMSVDVEFKTKKELGPDGKERKTIDVDDPFSKLKFNYMHLPTVGGTAKLWEDIMVNTFPKFTKAKRALYQAKARLALQGLQPGPGVYSSANRPGGKKLIFGKATQKRIEDYLNPPPARDLPGDAAPKWADYVNPDPQAHTKLGAVDYGQIGLRLGLYKDKKNSDQQKGTDRESHHTVQYLLLEYMVNSKDRHQPFPNLSKGVHPNIQGNSRVETISSKPGGQDGIKIATNETGRGGEMPTILLSVHAHSLGDVHVTPKADDLDEAAPSQGSAIHGIFGDALGPYKDLVRGKPGPLQAIENKRTNHAYKAADIPKVGGKEVTAEDLSAATFNASCKTYTWMRNYMNDKLKAAIDSREKEYYEALVATAQNTSIFADGKAKPGYEAQKAGATVVKNVLAKQKAILESTAFGFQEKT